MASSPIGAGATSAEQPSSLLLQKQSQQRVLVDLLAPVTSDRGPPSPQRAFDFMSLHHSSTGDLSSDSRPAPHLDFRLARGVAAGGAFSHSEAAHDGDAQEALAASQANAERILREAHEQLNAERAEAARTKKKDRKVRYVMADSDPLIKACKKGEDERVRELVAAQDPADILDYVNARDKNGSTPIFHTVWLGHLECLRILLENGADPNVQNNRQNTALHLCCEREHQDLILTLIQFGASITLLNLNNQVCSHTLADPISKAKMENFTKRCWNDVRRGHMGKQQYRLPKVEKRAEFWSASFYDKNYYADNLMSAEAARLTAELPETSELRQALETPKPQANEGGVPPVASFFQGFLDHSLNQSPSAPIEAADSVQAAVDQKARRKRRAAKRSDTTFISPASTSRPNHRRRRKSTGDLSSSGPVAKLPSSVTTALRALDGLGVEATDEQRQFVQFLILMVPGATRLPLPPPLPPMPRWLEEYAEIRAAERASIAARQAAAREAARPKLKEGHEYALTRLRTAALASASSPHFHARMLSGSGSRAIIPHASQPDLVRPVVALLRDLTVHLPTSMGTPTRVASSASATSLRRAHARANSTPSPGARGKNGAFSPSAPHGSGDGLASADSWDATRLALDREQASCVLKNPAYSNWVLRQLSALHEVEAASVAASISEPNAASLARADALHAASVAHDDEAMRICDPELGGLVDREVERFLQSQYAGPRDEATAKALKARVPMVPLLHTPAVLAGSSSAGLVSTSGVTPIKSKVPLHLSNLVAAPAAPSPRLNALAADFLASEKESYLRGLYVQVHSTLTRLKKSSKLYIAPSLARRLKNLNPSLLAALGPGPSGRLNSGGLRPEYATLAFSTSQAALASGLEQQVREMIAQRKAEREAALRYGVQQQNFQTELMAAATPSPAIDQQQNTTPPRAGQQAPQLTTAKKLARSGSAQVLNSSASASSLHQTPAAATGPALNSAALQRALVAQYNPRILSPFNGGGSYERAASPPSALAHSLSTSHLDFKLNTSPSKQRLPALDTGTDDPNVQVMEVHHSNPSSSYSTFRAALSRPQSSIELSLAKQCLELPSKLVANPLCVNAGPSAVGASRAKSPQRAPHGLATSQSHSQLFAELNPTRRPSSSGLVTPLQQRPGTSSSGTRPSTGFASPAARLGTPATGVRSGVQPIFDAPDRSVAASPHGASSVSLRLGAIADAESSSNESGLLKQIKTQDTAAKFLPSGRVAEMKAVPSTPSNSLSPHRNAFNVGVPSIATSTAVETEEKEQLPLSASRTGAQAQLGSLTLRGSGSLTSLTGARSSLTPKLGHSVPHTSLSPNATLLSPQQRADAPWNLHPLALTDANAGTNADAATGSRPTSAGGSLASPTSRASVNKEKALKRRAAHGVHPPTSTGDEFATPALDEVLATPSSRSARPASVTPLVASTPSLDPHWHPHPGMGSGSPSAYFAGRASSSPATRKARAADPSFMWSPPSRQSTMHEPVLSSAGGSAPRARSPVRGWDSEPSGFVASPNGRVLHGGNSFAVVHRPQAQLGLLAANSRR